MIIDKIPAIKGHQVNVIIETPKGFQTKFFYDQDSDSFRLKKILPLGMHFPFDFGFIPNTVGGDGDPLDVLVIFEGSFSQGCVVSCKLIGILKAEQKEKKEKAIRNDRLVAVPVSSVMYASINKIKDLGSSFIRQLEDFFVNYNAIENKKFTPLEWLPANAALHLIKSAMGKKETGGNIRQ